MKLSTTVVCCSLEIADSFETDRCCVVWQLNFWQAPSQILLEVSVRHFPEIKLAHSTTTDCFKTVYCAGIGLFFFATHHPPCTVCCCSALISTSRYRSSSASTIGTWYTSSCITPSIQSSTKYWRGLLASLMNWWTEVSHGTEARLCHERDVMVHCIAGRLQCYELLAAALASTTHLSNIIRLTELFIHKGVDVFRTQCNFYLTEVNPNLTISLGHPSTKRNAV